MAKTKKNIEKPVSVDLSTELIEEQPIINLEIITPDVEPEIIEEQPTVEPEIITPDVIIINNDNIDCDVIKSENDINTQLQEEMLLEAPEINILNYINLNYAQQKSLRRTGRLK